MSPPRSTIIPDGEISPVRLEADVPFGQPSPSHFLPACSGPASGLRWPSGAIGYRPFLAAVIALRKAGTHAGVRPLAPHVAQGPFTRAVCYHRRHRYYNPMRQSLAYQQTSRGLRLYRPPRGQETFPALHLRPCDRAAAPTPESSPEASARLFSEDTAFARIVEARRSQHPATAFPRGPISALQRFLCVAARSLARPPGQSRLATARALSSGFRRDGHPLSTSDSLRGCQATTAAGPSPAGLRWLQAAHYPVAIRGSSQSRTPSPSRLNPSAVRKIATPGKVGYHQYSNI